MSNANVTTQPNARRKSAHRDRSQQHQTLEAEEARQATSGNGVWMILSVSTGLAIAALLFLFGGAVG